MPYPVYYQAMAAGTTTSQGFEEHGKRFIDPVTQEDELGVSHASEGSSDSPSGLNA
jgi:hypothetical protein